MEKRKHSSEETPNGKRIKVSNSQTERNESQSQASLPRSANHIAGGEADHGIVEKIFLKNFMNHGKLEINFGSNVNFLVGQNGSGKSSLMTALVVGLGGKALVTNRGSSVKSFIKEGQNAAEISITLRNRGVDAYKPELYGNAIKVERRIVKDGSTTYKLKSDKGKVISNKKEELLMILDQFNIQVDNPITILNQDTSRNFLFSKDPKCKYKFFMKATQLEQIECDYSRIKEHESMIKDNIARKEEGLPELENNALRMEQRFKDMESLNTLRTKREKLFNVLAWAQIAEKEMEQQRVKSKIQSEESRIPKFESKVTEFQNKVRSAEEELKAAQTSIGEITETFKDYETQYLAKREAFLTTKSRMKDLQKLKNTIARQLDGYKRERDGLMKKIEEEKRSVQQDYDKERLQREAQIEELQRQKTECDARLAVTMQDLDNFATAVDGIKKRVYDHKGKLNDIKQNADQINRHIRQLESSKSNSLRLYGDRIPALLSEIDKNARKFDRKPKGPVGRYLSLGESNNKWALSVEVVLKGLTYAFCCHSHQDKQLLQQLLKKTIKGNTKPPAIIISRFEDHKHDITNGKVQGSIYPSFLDIVEVEDPVIFNCLVDQRSVENILMIERNEDARRYVQQPPRHCREAFTLSGDQVYAGSEQRYYSAMQKRVRVLKADVEDQIRQSRDELQNLQRQQEDLNITLRELNTELSTNERHKQRCDQQRRKLHNEIGHFQAEVQDLEAIEDPAPVDVSVLEDEVNQLNESIVSQEPLLEAKTQELKVTERDMKEKQKEHDEVKEKQQEVSYQVEQLKEEINKFQSNVARSKHDRKHYESKRNEQLKGIDDLKKEFEKSQQKVEEETEKVTQNFSKRIETRRSAKNIESEIQQMTVRIEKEQQTRGDPDVVLQQFDAAKKTYENAHKEIRKYKNTIKKLQDMLELRQRAFVQLRHFIALRTKHYFTLMLSQRKYNGKIKFIHKDETLLLEVHPTSGSEQNRSTDMRALSGGERSFSTVCFIMALWESMEAPFRVLDEFDVFMDMVNRRIVMDLLMQVANDHRSRQFIFLTPQDMSRIKASSLVRIQRLQGPKKKKVPTATLR